MENANKGSCKLTQPVQMMLQEEPSSSCDNNRYGWRTFDSVEAKDSTDVTAENDDENTTNNGPDGSIGECDKFTMGELELPQDLQDTENHRCHHSEDNTDTNNVPEEASSQIQRQEIVRRAETIDGGGIANVASLHADNGTDSMSSMRTIGSFVCRICHNAEHPERLVSPCLCKGSLTYVHINCLEHWISTSGKTTCELCQFRYKTTQTLRYTCLQSLRMWYSHSMSRRALQEDCQMFSLLTLVAFGIVGTILVGIQHHMVQERSSIATMARIWTKGWLLFFLFTTFTVYVLNVYMLAKGQLSPWYRWWQSAREIKLILENRKTATSVRRLQKPEAISTSTHLQGAHRNMPIAEEEVTIGTVVFNVYVGNNAENEGRRHALVPASSESDDTSTIQINNQQQTQEQQQNQHAQQQPQDEQQENNHNQVAVPRVDI